MAIWPRLDLARALFVCAKNWFGSSLGQARALTKISAQTNKTRARWSLGKIAKMAKSSFWPKIDFFGLLPAKSLFGIFRLSRVSRSLIQLVFGPETLQKSPLLVRARSTNFFSKTVCCQWHGSSPEIQNRQKSHFWALSDVLVVLNRFFSSF